MIMKNIDYAIPSHFIEYQEKLGSAAHLPKHWAERIEEQYFKKKEFLDYSLEEAQEKFLSRIGLYNIMFSSYYVVQKEIYDKRENDKMDLMNQIMKQKFGNVG